MAYRQDLRRPPRISGRFGVIPALYAFVSSCVVAACAGNLDPALFASGSDGSGGSPDSGGANPVCDAPTIVLTPKCGEIGCHDSNGAPASGLDLKSAGVVARLLDKTPDPASSLSCMSNTTPYLRSQSNPATGLLLDKLDPSPPCGTPMPQIGTLLPTETSCLQAWATAVTTGAITQ